VCASRPQTEDITVRYLIDTSASTFVVQAFATGLLAAFGHNPEIGIQDFHGTIDFSADSALVENARLSLRIKSDALEVLGKLTEEDRREIRRRMFEEVLETDRFPEIAYECSRATGSGNDGRYWLALNGELTLHGVTRALPISVKVVVSNDSLRASGEFTLRQTDYKISLVSAAAGAIRVKDELKGRFDIVARRQ